MPGFSLIFDTTRNAQGVMAQFDRALAAMKHDERYRAHPVAREATFLVGWTGYNSYPVRIWKSETLLVLMEGFAYGPGATDLTRFLDDTTRRNRGLDDLEEFLRGWRDAADGDFVIVCLSRADPGGILVVLDALGRLPVYWKHEGARLYLSREVKFINAVAQSTQPDRWGIAQALTLGFPWGERTLIENVSRLPAGAVLRWRPAEERAPTVSAMPWSFDVPSVPEGDRSNCAAGLAAEFTDACRRRAEAHKGYRSIVSLSGGLDSRAVAAALAKCGTSAEARTFTLGRQFSDTEASVAREIAARCGLSWKVHALSSPSSEAADHLVWLKDGLNSAAMAFGEEYQLGLVAEDQRPVALYGGLGGDVVLVPRHPHRRVRSVADLSALLLARGAVFPPSLVSALLGFDADVLPDQLRELLETYPEGDPAGQYLHFFIMSFEHKLYFEGEDRSRCYLWPVAPFYARPFFDQAIRAPYQWKRYRRLQADFLRQLHPAVAAIPNANTGTVPGSAADLGRRWLRETALSRPSLERLLGVWNKFRAREPEDLPDVLRRRLADLTGTSPVIRDLFRAGPLTELLAQPQPASRSWLLYTILRSIDLAGCSGSE